MKNYTLKIYYKNKTTLYLLERVFVTSIAFEGVTYEIHEKDERLPFDYIKFYKNGKEIASFFPNEDIEYKIVEE